MGMLTDFLIFAAGFATGLGLAAVPSIRLRRALERERKRYLYKRPPHPEKPKGDVYLGPYNDDRENEP